MLAILIVNYKDEDRTIAYVKDELSKIHSPHLIVVVNNSATDESNYVLAAKLNATLISDIHQKPEASGCYVISSNDNLGFAKGNNLGAEFAMKHFSITHILFTNNDIHFLNNNVVERLVEKLDTLDTVGMIGPKVKGLDGRNQSPEPYSSFWNRYIWMYWLTPFLSSDKKKEMFKLDYPQDAKEGEHYKIMGSFFIVKAQDFITCGMMDPNTFLYAEEVILTERLKKIHKTAYYFPQVAVLHEHGQTINQHFQTARSMKIQFDSESYYYHSYKGVSSFSISIGKISLNLYIKLKSHFKSILSL
ncbi:MAG: glycosyltransferase family 2 protein [Paludibacter sp.]|nr:glycosyltransferase family 2 protein [Paludibacter sp.]